MMQCRQRCNRYFLVGVIGVGLIYLRASSEKFASGDFAATLGGLLTKFASNNPFPWYQSFLNNVAIPNSVLFGNLTMWGEGLSGLAMLGAAGWLMWRVGNRWIYSLLLIGGAGGAFLNTVFWLATGYISPANDALNLLMLVVELEAVWMGVKLQNSRHLDVCKCCRNCDEKSG